MGRPDPLEGISARMVQTHRLVQHVYFSGPDDAAAVVFLHGNFSAALWWEETMLRLPAGYRGIAADLRGFGWTEDVPIDATRGIRDWTDDVVELMGTLGVERAHFVGWSLGGGILYRFIADHPQRVITATLVCPVSPYGIGGTRDVRGTPCHADFAGSGAGIVDSRFVDRIQTRDRSDSPGSPRSVINGLYYKPPFRAAREEDFLTASLMERTGDYGYPGDWLPSPNWPHVTPGKWGPINSLSPQYLGGTASDFLAVEPKPPILWIRGRDDQIVADGSLVEPGTQGMLGLREGWPGEEIYPPQPMIAQTRAVLQEYASRGGWTEERVMDDTAHSPHIERPGLLVSWLIGFWTRFEHPPVGSPPRPRYRPAPQILQMLQELDKTGNDLDRLTPESAAELWLTREFAAKNTLWPIAVQSVRDVAIPARPDHGPEEDPPKTP